MKRIKPKWVLFDNIELTDVRRAVKEAGLFKSKMIPEYFFDTNTHKGSTQPGIFMLVKLGRRYRMQLHKEKGGYIPFSEQGGVKTERVE